MKTYSGCTAIECATEPNNGEGKSQVTLHSLFGGN